MTQEVLDCLRGGQADNSVQQEEVVSDAAKDLRGSFPGEGAGRETAIPADREPEAAPGETPLPEPGRPERTVTREDARAAASAAIRTHWERLHEQAARLPGFDLATALRDPGFVRLTAPGVGVGVEDAWYALHRREEEKRRAEENRRLLAEAAEASARRPREGGQSAAALLASDYRSLSREEQLRVKKRILEAGARGEKLYP